MPSSKRTQRPKDFRSFRKLKIPFKFRKTAKLRNQLRQIELLEKAFIDRGGPPLPYVLLRRQSDLVGADPIRRLSQRTKKASAAHTKMKALAKRGGEISWGDLVRLHRVLIPSLNGRLRTSDVCAYGTDGEVLFTLPKSSCLPELLQDFQMWLEDSKEWDPWLRATAAHFLLISIHPFEDGNGRLARLAEEWILLRAGKVVAKKIPAETALFLKWRPYFLADQRARKEGYLNAFAEFIITNYCETEVGSE